MKSNAYSEAALIMEFLEDDEVWEVVYCAVVDHIQHTSNFDKVLRKLRND